jgi:hypothetical protein
MTISDPDSIKDHNQHRAYRVPGFLSCRPNWFPRPFNRKRVLLPLWFRGGGHTRLRERGWGGVANSDEGTDTLVLKVKYNPSMLSSIFINRSEQNSK